MSAATRNEILGNIAQCCKCVGLELLDDGIYYGNRLLVEFVHKDGQCCYIQTSKEEPQAEGESIDLLDIPIGQLTQQQREMLFGAGEELAF